MKIPIVSSTHWDREWRFSFQQTRAMLVELMDNLIELLDSNPEYKFYHLDAQTVVLEDYLEIRPERQEDLKRLVKQGRILVGPWYTLPDVCSIGGEAIIRNLLFGHKTAKEFGKVMKVGYTPTGFGQIAQLPQIYAGFEIDTILFYRGADRDAVKKEFLWEAPDGSRAVTYIFTPKFGRMPLFYCVASNYYKRKNFYQRDCNWNAGEGSFRLNDERSWKDLYYQAHSEEGSHTDSLKEDIKLLLEVEMENSCMDTFLLLDGVDSTEPQPKLVKLIEDMNNTAEDVTFYHASMEDFAYELKKAVPKMSVYKGEMRTSAKYGMHVNLMGAAISSRIYLKQTNDRTEKALINWAEPFSTFAWTMTAKYPDKFFELAWKYLIWNQSHDAIAGCSQDIVHNDMEYYFRQSEEISDVITNNALFKITGNISGEGLNEDDVLLVVYNPLPFERSEIVQASVDIPENKVISPPALKDTEGNIIKLQVDAGPEDHQILVHRPKHVPGIYKMKRWKISFMAEKIPSLGYKVFLIKADHNKPDESGRMHNSSNVIKNEYMSVSINEDGTFNIGNLKTGHVFKKLHQFEDSGEVGDPWTRKEPKYNPVVMGPSGYPQVHINRGELSSSIIIIFNMEVPGESDINGRSQSTVPVEIKATATLQRGVSWLSFRTVVKNNAKDHRLRVLFPSGVKTDYSFAEAPFEIMKREIKARDTSGWFEQGYTTYPQRGFAAVTDGSHGLAILNRGLPEYEVMDNAERTIAVTLLRCHKMFIPKLKTIDSTQQGSQCLGEHIFEYAVCPFNGDNIIPVQKLASAYGLPMKVAQSGRQKGKLPLQMSFLEVTSPLIISAIKRAEERESIVIRLFNPSNEEVKGQIHFYQPLDSAYLLNMEEQRLNELEIDGHYSVRLHMGGKKIVTLELEMEHEQSNRRIVQTNRKKV